MELNQSENLLYTRKTTNRESQLTKRDTLFVDYISDNRLASKFVRNSYNSITKTKQGFKSGQ
jgi:hypothetical protein